jgi:hypothetical protein
VKLLNIPPVLKTWVAAIGALSMVLTAVFADQVISSDEIESLILGAQAFLTTVGVWAAPNKDA